VFDDALSRQQIRKYGQSEHHRICEKELKAFPALYLRRNSKQQSDDDPCANRSEQAIRRFLVPLRRRKEGVERGLAPSAGRRNIGLQMARHLYLSLALTLAGNISRQRHNDREQRDTKKKCSAPDGQPILVRQHLAEKRRFL